MRLCKSVRFFFLSLNQSTVHSPKYDKMKYDKSLKYDNFGRRGIDFLTFHENHFAGPFVLTSKYIEITSKSIKMSSQRKARKSISNDVKLASVLALKKKEKTQQQIAAELNVKQSTVSHWMPKKQSWKDRVAAGKGKNKTMHQEQYPIVSKALLTYFIARSN